MVELLAPAGDFEKLKTALYFGADAVYLGGKDFSLRAFADNFTAEEMARAVAYAHALGKKVYVTANIFARNADFAPLGDMFAFLQEIGADAALVTDAGALALAKQRAPRLPLHLSTQANTTNKYAAKFWQEQGVSRVVLARELSLAEIAEIHAFCPGLELEAFVHGAMCISYSGRCLLSNYLDGRDSNRGACVQACRWRYEVRPEGGKAPLPAEEDARGTYVFNSKDLNMLPYLEELAAAGVCSFKIEGRMKSRYYLATVVGAYRRALDGAPCRRWRRSWKRARTAPLRTPMRSGRMRTRSAMKIRRRRAHAPTLRTCWRAGMRRSCRCAAGSASATCWKFCHRPRPSAGHSRWSG